MVPGPGETESGHSGDRQQGRIELRDRLADLRHPSDQVDRDAGRLPLGAGGLLVCRQIVVDGLADRRPADAQVHHPRDQRDAGCPG